MLNRSSSIAGSVFLDGAAAIQSLEQLAGALIESHPAVQCILLFGSLARGDYGRRSDADVLIVVQADERRPVDRIPEFLRFFLETPVPVDVFPYSMTELQRMIDDGNRLIRRALAEGIVLAGQWPTRPT